MIMYTKMNEIGKHYNFKGIYMKAISIARI